MRANSRRRDRRICALAALPITFVAAAAASAPSAEQTARFGVMTDVGVPDGAAASLVYRPLRAIRLDAGVANNLITTGVRGGITLAPFATWATPTLSLEYGKYPEGDANPIVRRVTSDPTFSSPALDRVGYDYASAHVGVELGHTRFTFFLHAGMSRVTGSVHGLESMVMKGSTTSISFSSDPKATIWTISADAGLILYLVN